MPSSTENVCNNKIRQFRFCFPCAEDRQNKLSFDSNKLRKLWILDKIRLSPVNFNGAQRRPKTIFWDNVPFCVDFFFFFLFFPLLIRIHDIHSRWFQSVKHIFHWSASHVLHTLIAAICENCQLCQLLWLRLTPRDFDCRDVRTKSTKFALQLSLVIKSQKLNVPRSAYKIAYYVAGLRIGSVTFGREFTWKR